MCSPVPRDVYKRQSHGLSEEVKKAAALKFSMGRITMPHQLARLVLRCV